MIPGQRSILRVLAVLIASVSIGSCLGGARLGPPGTTGGVITVNSVQVVTRERLLNDRNREAEWLDGQIDSVSRNDFGVQGLAQYRDATLTALNLTASNSVQRANVGRPGTTPPASPEGDLPRELQASPATGDTSNIRASLLKELLDANRDFLPKPEAIRETDADVTPVDAFRDLLAYRSEVRAELLETLLDDGHDLDGKTLYRLQFSPTVIAEKDTGSWAVLKVRVSGPEQTDEGWRELYDSWIDYLEDVGTGEIHSLALTAGKNAKQLSLAEAFGLLEASGKALDLCQKDQKRVSTAAPVQRNSIWQWSEGLRSDAGSLQPVNPLVLSNLNEASDVVATCLKELYRQRTNKSQNLASPIFSEFSDPKNDDSRLLVLQWLSALKVTQDIESSIGSYVNVQDGTLCPTAGCALHLKKSSDNEGKLNSFKARLRGPEGSSASPDGEAYVYSVTPKEMVQRISDVAAQRHASQVGVTLNALLGSVGLAAGLDRVRDTELMLHALRRQPLVVGFTDSWETWKKNDVGGSETKSIEREVEFGWLIGPQYKLIEDRKSLWGGTEVQFSFRHVNRQNALAAVVAVPSWWRSIKLEVVGCWLESESGAFNDCGGSGVRDMIDAASLSDDAAFATLTSGQSYKPKVTSLVVRVPADTAGIAAALGADQREPITYRDGAIANLTVGAPGHVLIPGVQLWRNTVVTVGSQKADSITVMPNMQGILAKFETVLPPAGWPDAEDAGEQPVSVWTSTGRAVAGTAHFFALGTKVGRVAIASQPVIGGERLELDVSQSLLPESYSDRRIDLRRFDSSGLGNWSPHKADFAVDGGRGTVSVKLETDACGQCTDGTIVEAAFVVLPRPGTEEYHKSQNVGVFYKSVEASRAGIVKDDGSGIADRTLTLEEVKGNKTIDIVLPVNVQAAFRDFNPATTPIDVRIGNQQETTDLVEIGQATCRPPSGSGTFANRQVCTYRVTQSGLDKHFNEKKTGESFRLSFRALPAPAIDKVLTINAK